MNEFDFDVAFSFAGEDREYVDQVAELLKKEGIKVFYDKFETVDLWGKDLGLHFDYIYRKSARYCIPFISKSYKKKVWTNYEIRTAIAAAIQTNEEYILPARFDDTEIDGIRPTLGFIDLRNYSPEEFAGLVIAKIKGEPGKPITQTAAKPQAEIYFGLNAHFSSFGLGLGASFTVNITNLNREYRYFNEPYFKLSKPFKGNDALYLRDRVTPLTFPLKLEYGQTTGMTYMIQPESIQLWEELPQDTNVIAIATTTVGESFESNEVTVSKIVKLLNAS